MTRTGGITLFLCGDVMTGRGIDQIMTRPVEPILYEPYVRDARDYVRLAEAANGPIPRGVEPAYVWGDALEALALRAPDVRLINLETAVTRGGEPWPGKGIHYRMDPSHVSFLAAAGIDGVSLANNHTLDWGRAGLVDTLDALRDSGTRFAGAGPIAAEARAPVAFEVAGRGRILFFSAGVVSSGIPPAWAAAGDRSGVYLLTGDPVTDALDLSQRMQAIRRPGDVVAVSIHWGGNWGYAIPAAHREFAHRLIEQGGADVIHGHSSHHPLGIEVYRGKLVLYGCGDFINDYEGIHGHEKYRGDLSLMYFAEIDPHTGRLAALRMRPTQMHRFRVRRAFREDAEWLQTVLDREGRALGTRVRPAEDGELVLEWE